MAKRKPVIKRACTFNFSIRMTEDPANFSKIVVSFVQDETLIVEKQKADMTLYPLALNITLTQAETRLFRPSIKSPKGARIGSPVYIQLRLYKSDSVAPGSDLWEAEVSDSLNDEVLSNE